MSQLDHMCFEKNIEWIHVQLIFIMNKFEKLMWNLYVWKINYGNLFLIIDGKHKKNSELLFIFSNTFINSFRV